MLSALTGTLSGYVLWEWVTSVCTTNRRCGQRDMFNGAISPRSVLLLLSVFTPLLQMCCAGGEVSVHLDSPSLLGSEYVVVYALVCPDTMKSTRRPPETVSIVLRERPRSATSSTLHRPHFVVCYVGDTVRITNDGEALVRFACTAVKNAVPAAMLRRRDEVLMHAAFPESLPAYASDVESNHIRDGTMPGAYILFQDNEIVSQLTGGCSECQFLDLVAGDYVFRAFCSNGHIARRECFSMGKSVDVGAEVEAGRVSNVKFRLLSDSARAEIVIDAAGMVRK